MLILQVGLKSCVLPRQKRWHKSFCRTRLQLATRGQNVAKNKTTLWRTRGKVTCSRTRGRGPARPRTRHFFTAAARPRTRHFYRSARPSTRHFSARPPKRGLIFGHVLASPGQLEPSSAKRLIPSFLSRQDATFKTNL